MVKGARTPFSHLYLMACNAYLYMFCGVLLFIHPVILVSVIALDDCCTKIQDGYHIISLPLYPYMYQPLPQPCSPSLHLFLPSIPLTPYLSLSFSMPLYLPLCISHNLYLYPSICISLSISLYLSLYLYLYPYISLYLYISVSVSLSLFLSIYLELDQW